MKLYTYDREKMRWLFQNDQEYYKKVCTSVCYSEYSLKNRTPDLSMIKAVAEELVIRHGADRFEKIETIHNADDAYNFLQGNLGYLGLSSAPSAPRHPSKVCFM